MDADGKGASLRRSAGQPWRYQGLAAWDAAGARLQTGLLEEGGDLLVLVRTGGASWPVTFDPSLALEDETKLPAPESAASYFFAYSVSGGGDINGDGYADFATGAYSEDHRGTNVGGSAFVYYGGKTRVVAGTEHALTASDGASGDMFGFSMSILGDVDGDGYHDLAVGALGEGAVGTQGGAVYLYGGGPWASRTAQS